MERNGWLWELYLRTNPNDSVPTFRGLLEKNHIVPQMGTFNKFSISKLGKLPSPFSISSYFKRCLFSQVPFLTTSLLILAEFTAIFGKNRGNKVRISPTLCPLQMHLATYTPDSHPVDEASILPAQGSPLHLTASSMHTGPRYVCLAHHCSLCI